MLGTSRIAVFFQWFVVPAVRKVASVKRRVRRSLLSRAMKNGTPLWREAHLYVKMYKTPQGRSHFGSCDVEKWHAAVARSPFVSQNVQNTSCSEPFWKLRCGKMARRCGAKHIFKSKCTKHHNLGAIFEVAIWKNGTPLSREAHLQVKILKNWRVRTTFWRSDVEKLHAAVARSTFWSENVQNTCVFAHFWSSDVENQSVSKIVRQSISQVVN